MSSAAPNNTITAPTCQGDNNPSQPPILDSSQHRDGPSRLPSSFLPMPSCSNVSYPYSTNMPPAPTSSTSSLHSSSDDSTDSQARHPIDMTSRDYLLLPSDQGQGRVRFLGLPFHSRRDEDDDDDEAAAHLLSPHSSHEQVHGVPSRARRRKLSSWAFLFGTLVLASGLTGLYFYSSMATYVGQWMPPAIAAVPAGMSTKAEPATPTPTEVAGIAHALQLKPEPYLHHDGVPTSAFTDLELEYYALPLTDRRVVRPIYSLRRLLADPQCATSWVASGTLCPHLPQDEASRKQAAAVDILYTWVNGSASHSAIRILYSDATNGWWEEHWKSGSVDKADGEHEAVASITSSMHGKRAWKAPKLKADNGDNRFRDTSELLFSVRSSMQHIKGLGSIHIVSPDFAGPLPSELEPDMPEDRFLLPAELVRFESRDLFLSFPNNRTSLRRAGQVPSWLNASRPDVLVGGNAIRPSRKQHSFRVHHDWTAFTPSAVLKPSTLNKHINQSRVEAWKHAVLPTFNSMAIESYLGNEEGLEDVFLYANDDFFLTHSLTASDVHTPLYGLVMRMQSHLPVIGHETGFIHPADHVHGGEWPSYRYSAWLLDRRFGRREYGRAYLSHVHKSLHRALLEESRIVFDKAIRDAAGSRFRGLGESINTPFLTHDFVIERHREALLWSFFLLRHDVNGDGRYGRGPGGEWETLLCELGVGSEYTVRPLYDNGNDRIGGPAALNNIVVVPDFATAADRLAQGKSLMIAVPMPRRASLQGVRETLQAAGVPEPGMSKYAFSSLDGYPFVHLEPYVQDRTQGIGKGAPFRWNGNGARPWAALGQPHGGLGNGAPPPPPESWPRYWPSSSGEEGKFKFNPRRPACRIALDQCFRREWTAVDEEAPRADEVFKRFAFEKVECGDCLLQFLLHKSGERGFSAFLPDKDLLFPSQPSPAIKKAHRPHKPLEPHLPLVAHYDDDITSSSTAASGASSPTFTLQTVATLTGWLNRSRHAFALSLLTRYAFTLADSPMEFVQTTINMRSSLNAIVKAEASNGFLCINDDVVLPVGANVEKAMRDRDAVQGAVRDFMRRTWPTPTKFELQQDQPHQP